MSFKYCIKECHENQPVAFVIRENNQWVLCCAMCQFESDLPKQSFTALKDLEKINKEIREKLDSSEIVQHLYGALFNLKQWQTNFEKLLFDLKSQIQLKVDHFSSLIETLNQKIEYFIFNNEKLQEVLNFREQLKVDLENCESDIQNLQMNLENAFLILTLGSSTQQTEKETKVPSIIDGQTDKPEKSNSNSIISEQKPQSNISQQIEIEKPVDLPNPKTMSVLKVEELKQQGRIQLDQNTYYEGEVYKGMMHGKGKLVQSTPTYECIYEGEFFENKKHGAITETQIEIEDQDINQSFFKSLNLIKPTNQRKLKLIGIYKDDKKIEVFTKITYLNDVIESQRYQYYDNGTLTGEFSD
ncbi:unnamed protein product (macronuclear) [Paramecium tetraurelia]|uniref:MORN repeat protein n=1 Tax=Paramecium tetraurelia TaxID=5888 RepID=A0DEV6_PARTE|nr:uncharacterized protein GSPATT00016399001 [Paramecium tetraurelia]CAK81573.1 unnamed protein product [Paramecium tetraurelia]|eukprot:XP_001448970.1 hypothetical protein (macronuclear) [Paramecium tetraurelia strain d4-2]